MNVFYAYTAYIAYERIRPSTEELRSGSTTILHSAVVLEQKKTFILLVRTHI